MAVIITKVQEGTLAEKAGLQRGDQLLRINGVIPKDQQHALRLIQESDKAQSLNIIIIREGIEMDIVLSGGRGNEKIGINFLEEAEMASNTEGRLAQLEAQAKTILNEINEIRGSRTSLRPPLPTRAAAVAKLSYGHLPPASAENTETQIGKYILSKIGVVSIVAGVAFLIAYTFRYLLPVHKIFIGYAISIAMLYFGMKIERHDKFKWYGRGLISGGWVLAYFTTFAMHHIKATRIVQSQIVDLVLLSAIVGAMIAHLLKYKSQSILAMTLFLGYLTAGISQEGIFTFIYIFLLAVVTVILAYKMNWQYLALISLAGTYITHLIWVLPQMYLAKPYAVTSLSTFRLSMAFLTLYWVVYNFLPLIMRIGNDRDARSINGFVIINALLFGILGFLEVHYFNLAWRFQFAMISAIMLAIAGIVSRYSSNGAYVPTAYYVAAIAFATTSLPFRFNHTIVDFIWLAELPILIYLGARIMGKVLYRIATWVLSFLVVIKLLMQFENSSTLVVCMGRNLSERLFLFAASVICFYLIRYLYADDEKDVKMTSNERYVPHLYTVLGTAFLVLLSFFEIQRSLVTLMWAVSAFLLFTTGFFIKDKYFRYVAIGTIALVVLRIITVDLAGVNTIYRIVVFICLGAVLLIASYWYTKMSGLGTVMVSNAKRYASFGLIAVMPLGIATTAIFYPSEFRQEEVKRVKEIDISNKFIAGAMLTDEETAFLRSRKFGYLISEMRKIFWRDKGRGYNLYKRSISLGVESQEIYTALAQLCISRNEIEEAIVYYEKAVALDPAAAKWQTRDYLKALAGLYFAKGDFHGAAKYYEKYLVSQPSDAVVLYNLASCYTKMEEYDKAMDLLNKSVRVDPGNRNLSDTYRLMGFIFESKGVLGEAERYYNESVRIDAKNKEAEAGLKRLREKSKVSKF